VRAFLASPMRDTCMTHLIIFHNLITLSICDNNIKWLPRCETPSRHWYLKGEEITREEFLLLPLPPNIMIDGGSRVHNL
jgi:hypothetical protein